MSEVVSLKQGALWLEDRWLQKLGLSRSGKVSVEVHDDTLVVRPVLQERKLDAATKRLLDFLSLPVGSLSHLAIPPEREREDEFDWNPDEDID